MPQGKPEGLCLPCKGRWVAVRQAGGIFLKKIDFKKKVLRCLIPQSTHFVRSQLLTGESPLCRSATFPHTVGNHPFQGSLNKSLSLLTSFADSSLFKGAFCRFPTLWGNTLFEGAYLSPLFLPENTVKMFKTVFNTCQKVQNSKTLTICS